MLDTSCLPGLWATGCEWPVAATFDVPTEWTSGGYIIIFRGERDGAEVTQDGFFVLRAASPGERSRLALVVATYSWQEYNDWGGGCGYFSDEFVDHSMDPLEVREKSFKARLSFQRPWSRGLIRTPVGAPRLAQSPPPVGAQVGAPAADWAISYGYSVWNGLPMAGPDTTVSLFDGSKPRDTNPNYSASGTSIADPSILDNYDVVVTTGHDEYWTAGGRKVLDDFIERGGRYARLAGNIVWQVRLEDDLRTQVCHKYAAHADPEIGEPRHRRAHRRVRGDPHCRSPGHDIRSQRLSGRSTHEWAVYRHGGRVASSSIALDTGRF